MQLVSGTNVHLELSKMLAHLALLIHLHHQVKIALGIFWGSRCVRSDDKLSAAILIL